MRSGRLFHMLEVVTNKNNSYSSFPATFRRFSTRARPYFSSPKPLKRRPTNSFFQHVFYVVEQVGKTLLQCLGPFRRQLRRGREYSENEQSVDENTKVASAFVADDATRGAIPCIPLSCFAVLV